MFCCEQFTGDKQEDGEARREKKKLKIDKLHNPYSQIPPFCRVKMHFYPLGVNQPFN